MKERNVIRRPDPRELKQWENREDQRTEPHRPGIDLPIVAIEQLGQAEVDVAKQRQHGRVGGDRPAIAHAEIDIGCQDHRLCEIH